jgi:hypothetical protein
MLWNPGRDRHVLRVLRRPEVSMRFRRALVLAIGLAILPAVASGQT